MQFTNTIIAAMAVIGASAAPSAWNTNPPPSGSGGSSGGSASCPTTSNEYCCDNGALLGLECILSSILGNTCSQQTICCVDNGGEQSCSQTDGTTINIPINIGHIL